MKAIILAAGEGTRLRPYTLDRPKCLVEINGISLLERQLLVLRSRGVNEIVIVGGYRAEMLEAKATKLIRNPLYAETNMVWSLFCAMDSLNGEAIVTYGDIVYSGDILDKILGTQADIAVTIDLEWESYWRSRNSDILSDAETLKLNPHGKIIEIGKKPSSIAEIEGQYMGLTKFSKKGLKALKEVFHTHLEKGFLGSRSVKTAHMTDLLQTLISSGYDVTSTPIRSPWIEVDTVRDLQLKLSLERVNSIMSELARYEASK